MVAAAGFQSPEGDVIWSAVDEARHREFARAAADVEGVSLSRLAILVARGEYPTLEVDDVVTELAAIAARIDAHLGRGASDGQKIEALNHHLFEKLAFTGDDVTYGDPRNAYLNEVMARRTGLPITLSILYIDVASRLGLRMVGVGLPGHFIVRYAGHSAAAEIFVDPFHQGRVLTKTECVAMVQRLSGGRLPWHDDYLKNADNRYLITRLLNNLKGCYARAADARRALRVQNYLLVLHPEAAHELRDRGVILAQLQSYRGALEDLERYLRMAPGAPDTERVQELVRELRGRVASLS